MVSSGASKKMGGMAGAREQSRRRTLTLWSHKTRTLIPKRILNYDPLPSEPLSRGALHSGDYRASPRAERADLCLDLAGSHRRSAIVIWRNALSHPVFLRSPLTHAGLRYSPQTLKPVRTIG